MSKIKVGIVGYGNLGRGVEMALRQNEDMELAGIFTRRQPEGIAAAAPMIHISEVENYIGKIDVMILCGGSATDLPEQGPSLASMFNTVDSFDRHAKIPEYFESVNASAKRSGYASVISTGWDPGLFSLNRLLAEAVLPEGKEYTFWGRGVSQGHSDAIRRVQGVKNAVQYTIPSEHAVSRVRNGEDPVLSTREKHQRECFVVAEPGEDLARIEHEIKTMPDYFADYDTTVHFISIEELQEKHGTMPHGGLVLRSGKTGENSKQIIEFGLNLASNPEFTASVLVAYARAIVRYAKEGFSGAKTVFDIPFSYLSPKSDEQLRKELL
ncbi:diaminopimelate dehydrogenase [Paenibacillus sp. UNCCL117]|uniref:diaminopimelate dehydrogenase n=1 Tax=unclassified Paenibacillus TaxID=185978 RepID=UPI000881107D|nr:MULTISPECIES: diaminopimelate dehydrogenase [unclassified Paenibacillus]SDD50459.1 diaminopimelate dehydrogenase [Paenibacillus sp. cl123]SFW49723.1 diaminopimelate dehydrogenase [Paenibacillus sp. UNCCL117]